MARTDYEEVGGGGQLVFGETHDAVRVPGLVGPGGQFQTLEALGVFTTQQELMQSILAELRKINLQLASMTGMALTEDVDG